MDDYNICWVFIIICLNKEYLWKLKRLSIDYWTEYWVLNFLSENIFSLQREQCGHNYVISITQCQPTLRKNWSQSCSTLEKLYDAMAFKYQSTEIPHALNACTEIYATPSLHYLHWPWPINNDRSLRHPRFKILTLQIVWMLPSRREVMYYIFHY